MATKQASWRREPLVHFILLGLLLFIGNYLWEKKVASNTFAISVTQNDITRLANQFEAETRQAPSQNDMEALLASFVEEEALVREAVRLGLDGDDTIIRRRLAQKMRFILQNNDTLPTPARDELKEWYEANKDRFIEPTHRTFSHVFFRQKPENIAEILSNITDENWASTGHAFIEGRDIKFQSKPWVAKKFGTDFSNNVFLIPKVGVWEGPYASTFGWHLVRVDNITEIYQPKFDDISTSIQDAWGEEQLRNSNQKKLSDLIRKYDVTIEGASN